MMASADGLGRYRAKVADPKGANVMPSCLAIGLVGGVRLPCLAAAGARDPKKEAK